MKPRAFTVVLLAFFIFISSFVFPAFADFKLLDVIQEFGERRYVKLPPARIRSGPVRFHPFVRSKVEYDDNVLLANEDKRKDVVFNVNPGAIVDLPIQQHRFTAGYEAEFETLAENSHQNGQNQNFFVLGNAHFPSWYINVLEKFAATSSRAGTTFTARIPRYDQVVHPKIGYHWKRLVFEAGFRHFYRDFRRQVDDSLDFKLREWTGVIYYDLFARLKALWEYQLAQISYPDNSLRDGTFQQTRVGFDGELFPNFIAKVRVGPQFRNYGASEKTDFNSWVGDLSLEYQVRKNLKFDFQLAREPVEATFQNVDFYTEHALRTGVEYKIGLRWTAFSQFKYIRHDYAERSTIGNQTGFRHDSHLYVKSGLRYLVLEWLEFQTAYEFAWRNSNFSTFDYTDNQFFLSTNLTY